MHDACFVNNARLVRSVRVTKRFGLKTSRHEMIKNMGLRRIYVLNIFNFS